MIPESERAFARMLVEQGLARREDVEACLAELEILAARGAGPLPKLGDLLVKRGHAAPARPAAAPGMPDEAAAAPATARFGRYVAVQKLGAGGMGEVWKAWDTPLGRWVALKFLRGSDDDEVARFKREAQVAAKLAHPNIAAVHEVGEGGGRHFIAMQYVAGQTLRTFPRDDRRRLAAVVRDAARAIHYAHGAGVVHRDVKPDNLMVEDGRVFVMDFGLARQLKGPQLSASGMMVGTPAYMPPEQARGLRSDPRADVYSLGATLYELLGDRPPFSGSSAIDVVMKVISEDPRPIEGELGVIVGKAMEKDPARRYASAAELADDLDRWLGGEPILARPPSLRYRLRKKLAKRKAVVATAALGAAAVAVSLALVVPPWLEKSRRLEAAAAARPHLDRGRDVIREMERILSADEMDLEALRAAGDRARAEFAKARAADPGGGEAHLEEARTWVLEAQRDLAQRACDRAVEADPRLATARLERARILADRYEDLRHEHHGRPLPETAETRDLWRRIEEDVAAVERWSGKEEERDLARGVRAFAEARYAEAGTALTRYAEAHAGNADAWLLAGRAWLHAPDVEAAARALTRVIELQRASALGWLLRGVLWAEHGKFDRADADLTRALELAPRYDKALLNRGVVRMKQGRFAEAEADLTRVVEALPRSAPAWFTRGGLRHRQRRFVEAEADYTKATEIDPADADAWLGRGHAREDRGRLDEAEADFTRAIALRPDMALAFGHRAGVRGLLGRLADADLDLARALELAPRNAELHLTLGELQWLKRRAAEAEAAYSRSIELDPGRALAWTKRGTVRHEAGRLAEAEADYDRAIALEPSAMAHNNRGNLRQKLKRFDEADADFTRAIELEPESLLTHYNRGNCRRELRRWAEAERDYTRAIELDAGFWRAWLGRGGVRGRLARWADAAADWERAVELEPSQEKEYRPRIEEARRRAQADK